MPKEELTPEQEQVIRSALMNTVGAPCEVKDHKFRIKVHGEIEAKQMKLKLDSLIQQAELNGTPNSHPSVMTMAAKTYVEVLFMNNEFHFPPSNAMKLLAIAQQRQNEQPSK